MDSLDQRSIEDLDPRALRAAGQSFEGYTIIRAGRAAEGVALMGQLVQLDHSDQTKTRALLAVSEGALAGSDP